MKTQLNAADLDRRFAFAESLVREAGQLALDMRNAPSALGVEAKGVRDFATAADKAVEELIVARLTEAFGDAVLGEEFGGAHDTRTLWIVDPIDGTYNYMHANPRWCVSLGFLVEGKPELAVVYAPVHDEMYLARRGQGATRNGVRLAVSSKDYATAPLVETGTSSRLPLKTYLDLVERLMSNGIETRRGGSGVLGLAGVASGETDAYVEGFFNSWDAAAGLLLVTEAGGRVNDFFAGDGIRSGNPIFATTPWLADRLSVISGLALMPA